jgi:hypothetical protein
MCRSVDFHLGKHVLERIRVRRMVSAHVAWKSYDGVFAVYGSVDGEVQTDALG